MKMVHPAAVLEEAKFVIDFIKTDKVPTGFPEDSVTEELLRLIAQRLVKLAETSA